MKWLSPSQRRKTQHIALALLAAGYGCSAPAKAPVRADEGFINVEGGRIWYRRVGNGPGTPLLLLHGGPGSTSYGLKPLLALATDRPVIIYDQLGCGKSDHPTDTTLYTVGRFVRELQTLRDSLGLKEIHLFGQSWGGMLAEAYMGSKPTGVKSLILSSPLVTTAQWEHDADSLIKSLPDSLQQSIAKHEADHTTDSPEYGRAVNAYYAKYVTRTASKHPIDSDSSRASSGTLVYQYMWGPSEFTSTGTLKAFDATSWLREISIPTLFLSGEYDEATPSSTKQFSQLVKGSEFVVIPGSGHVTQNDNLDALLGAVRGFLARVEPTATN
ncbi:MAG: proline iminopeptidase-family hydrolase [Gemmatimonadaceae bacterium]